MSIVKIQVPIEKTLRDKLEARATKLGFDSVQAYIRFWATAEADGRRVNFGEDSWGEPSDEAAARLNKAAEEARLGINVSEPFNSVEAFMKDLRE
jgi:hypothetical protein